MRWSNSELLAAAAVVVITGCRSEVHHAHLACPSGTHQVSSAPGPREMAKCVDEQGLLEGPAVEYCDDNLHLQHMFNFHAGKSEGLSTTWHCDGSKFTEEEFHDGKWHGRRTTWVDGKKAEEAHYRNGVLEGMSRRWDDAGHLQDENHYEHGKLEGEQHEWNAVRSCWETTPYRNGEPVGISRCSDAPPEAEP